MEKKREISEYRERLDKTLASHELTDKQTLKTLIRNQLNQESNEEIMDQRVTDLSSILDKLRSASTKDQDLSKSTSGDWKVKHDHEDCRVMYREGLEGSPFHTLLVEGYMDGPVEDCLCVSWESSLYEKWWPKSTFPAFKILQTKCLQKFRPDEQICLVRMKVPWPMTNREAIAQYFLFQYIKDGLVIILLNSISSPEEVESIDKSELAEAVNAVRVDLVGGVAIQKVNPERSYLRYIAEFDIKLDFIPPSLINFMSRQLLGNGFRLFKKTIGSVAKSDDYRRVLAYPLYTQIREALYSTDRTDESKNELHNQEGRHCEDIVLCKRDEIEEEECVSSSEMDKNVTRKIQNKNERTRFCISPEVKQALGTLERVISMVRKSRTYDTNRLISAEEEEEPSSPTLHSERTEIVSTSKVCVQDPTIEVLDEASLTHFLNSNRHSGSSSFAREGNKIAPGSPEIDLKTNSEVTRITISQATTLFSQKEDDNNEKPSGINGDKSSILQRKRKPGCFGFKSWMRKT